MYITFIVVIYYTVENEITEIKIKKKKRIKYKYIISFLQKLFIII